MYICRKCFGMNYIQGNCGYNYNNRRNCGKVNSPCCSFVIGCKKCNNIYKGCCWKIEQHKC